MVEGILSVGRSLITINPSLMIMHSMPYAFLLEIDADLGVSSVVANYLSFAGYFAVYGALGFYFGVLRKMRGWRVSAAEAEPGPQVHRALLTAERSAALIGLIGGLLILLYMFVETGMNGAEKGLSLTAALSNARPLVITQFVLAVLFILTFAAAMRHVSAAWVIALLAGVVLLFRNVVTGRWTTLVNPIHQVSASVWLGTLFVLVVSGLPSVLRASVSSENRGALAAELVTRFSPVALMSAGVLGISGLVTGWRHIKYWSALWTTPYGLVLDVKLLFVIGVVAMGAWNWRRMSPRLGAEEAGHAIRRSATSELVLAAIVLLITAILLGIPSPKLPPVV